MEKLKEKLKGVHGGRILDVGTGRGSFISRFLNVIESYDEIIGIDSEEKHLEVARGMFTQDNIKFVKMDAANMSFEDNSFDIVCLSNTLHHLPNMNKTLEEMKRVLKPGGLFIVSEMFCDNQSTKQLSHVEVHHFQGDMDTIMGICHDRTFTKQQIVDIVHNLNIKIVDSFEYNTHDEQISQWTQDEEKETLDEIFGAMENRIKLIEDKPEYSTFRKRLDNLKATLYDNGFFTATQIIIVGNK